jgi:Family of unknown function (DUF6508)
MDNSIDENINNISKDDWNELFKLIPKIENTNIFGELIVDKKTPEGDLVFPYMSSSEIVDKFHDTVYDKKMVVVFDWMKWDEGRDILENNDSDFSKLDLMTLVKLITSIVRYDRFSTGYLVGKFEDGTILKILFRLRDIISKSEKL